MAIEKAPASQKTKTIWGLITMVIGAGAVYLSKRNNNNQKDSDYKA